MSALTLRLPDSLKDKLQTVSCELGLSLNAVVVVALDAYLRGRLPVKATKAEARESKSTVQTISRNAPCPCGSGKKYKRCCGASTESKSL